MITEQYVNVFTLDPKVYAIAHQANCRATMNSGFARELREIYPEAYAADVQMHKSNVGEVDGNKLGKFSHAIAEDGRLIFNVYGQLTYGKPPGRYTDYNALEAGLTAVIKSWPILKGGPNHLAQTTLAMPHGIGCGRGGGDWSIVGQTLIRLFKDSNINLHLCLI